MKSDVMHSDYQPHRISGGVQVCPCVGNSDSGYDLADRNLVCFKG